MKRTSKKKVQVLAGDPQWYKDAVIYELHVRSFADSDGNGIGDFRGLTDRLDYLADLGITAIWILPFYPSPLRDDGYDIADYTRVNPTYGTLADVKRFIKEAHARGLRIITELVCNHTSDQHPWFQRARRAKPGSAARDFYVWSDTQDRYKDARIIFKDFELSNWTWDPVAQAYYWHRFFSHQPDLNFENPQVQQAMFRLMDFWFGLGIDGLRLDAVPYLFERDGTSCENLPETHAYLKKLRAHVEEKFQDRMLLAEANQWPEEAVPYFGDGDECHMAFHFPLMPRLFMSIHQEDRFPIIEIMDQTPAIPESCQWALFLRNHDELTLEMVTDEERDYMYRTYAKERQARINLGIRRRLAPLLENQRRKIELMNGLLFSMPGTPVIYYGDEIGMGDNIYLGDRNGVRTPMQWSADRNAGFSRANPQRLYLPIIIDPEYHYEAINVAAQQGNSHSLLWWMKRLIGLRKRFRAFARGSLTFLHPENRKVLAFIRKLGDERILVVANLSRFVQFVELDLSEYSGAVPVELFGRVSFPAVGRRPYFLSLGPHNFYWFSLEAAPATSGAFVGMPATQEVALPTVTVEGGFSAVFKEDVLKSVLPDYLQRSRWFGGKASGIKSTRFTEMIPLSRGDAESRPKGGDLSQEQSYITLLRVEDLDGRADTYQLPLAWASGERGERILKKAPASVLCHLQLKQHNTIEQGVLYEPFGDREFGKDLLEALGERRRIKGENGELQILISRTLRQILAADDISKEPALLHAEQSNTSLVFGKSFLLKLIRKVEPGRHPDVEISRFLSERQNFERMPRVLGTLEFSDGDGEPMVLGILQSFVQNEGDAWHYTLDVLGNFLERAAADEQHKPPKMNLSLSGLLNLVAHEPALEEESFQKAHIGPYLESARLLGQRTAELHLALAADADDPEFAPEPFTPFYQRSIYQSIHSQIFHSIRMLRFAAQRLPEAIQQKAGQVLESEPEILKRLQLLIAHKLNTVRIRHHGDYHLGQVLYTGKDFYIIDFEGQPARPLSERLIKRSPLRDVAGMLRSFNYASRAVLFGKVSGSSVRPQDISVLEAWARYFCGCVCTMFLREYLRVAGKAPFVPQDRNELDVLLGSFLLEKAFYELGYELNHRPDWIAIPLDGILQLLGKHE